MIAVTWLVLSCSKKCSFCWHLLIVLMDSMHGPNLNPWFPLVIIINNHSELNFILGWILTRERTCLNNSTDSAAALELLARLCLKNSLLSDCVTWVLTYYHALSLRILVLHFGYQWNNITEYMFVPPLGVFSTLKNGGLFNSL